MEATMTRQHPKRHESTRRLWSVLAAGLAALSLVPGLSSAAHAACPDYLDQEFRKLHSQESVNLCAVSNGKPLLVINTASHCGYTKQFKGLEALYQQYREQGLAVVGFASNDFRQEAKSEEKAAEVCYVNYGVTFTMLAPTHVRGDNANPVFAELARQAGAPNWNFNKYLVSADGTVVEHFGSGIEPQSAELRNAIERQL
jgi:glutathione peroxidase